MDIPPSGYVILEQRQRGGPWLEVERKPFNLSQGWGNIYTSDFDFSKITQDIWRFRVVTDEATTVTIYDEDAPTTQQGRD